MIVSKLSQPIRPATRLAHDAARRRYRANPWRPVEHLPQSHRPAPAGFGSRWRFLRAEFSTRSHRALGRSQGASDRLFRADFAGSRFPSADFPVPLYRRPRDLVAAGYKRGSVAFPNKGVRISRRDENNVPSVPRPRRHREPARSTGRTLNLLAQESVRPTRDPDRRLGARDPQGGTPLRVSFNSPNSYRSRLDRARLIDRNLISRKQLSTQRIRDSMAAHPKKIAKVRAANRSYVFFRITGLTNEGGPVRRREYVAPGRFIAVDRVHEYGTPFFIEAICRSTARSLSRPSAPDDHTDYRISDLGPARADLYWGAGDEAGRIAGRIAIPAAS